MKRGKKYYFISQLKTKTNKNRCNKKGILPKIWRRKNLDEKYITLYDPLENLDKIQGDQLNMSAF